MRDMLLQKLGSEEPLLTYGTLVLNTWRTTNSPERMLCTMHTHMRLQIAFGCECSLTDLTFEWSFT